LLPPPREIVLYDGQRQGKIFVSDAGRKKSMGIRLNVGLAAIGVLVIGAGAFYWLHERASSTPPSMAASGAVPRAPRTEETSGRAAPEAERDAKKEPAAPTPSAKKNAPPVEPGLALRAGEVLEYSADVAKVSNVASLRLQVGERRNFLGKSAWHLQAFAHTQNPLRMVFELDDQFDSYSDAGTMTSLQYEMHLNERGQKVDSVQRMTTTGREPASANASETQVLPGTRDPLGFMQYLRGVNWIQTREVHGPVYDGHRLYEVRAALVSPSEAVTVPTGSYKARKVEIRVFADGSEMKDAHFALYLADEPAHTPVLLEAILPWTTARVALKSKQ
jgi:Protein of unknown function (DUF3108)